MFEEVGGSRRPGVKSCNQTASCNARLDLGSSQTSEPSAKQLHASLILDRVTNSRVSSNAPPIIQIEVVLFTVNMARGCKAMLAYQRAQPLRIEAKAFGKLSSVHHSIISS
jgi:hypothetical protein